MSGLMQSLPTIIARAAPVMDIRKRSGDADAFLEYAQDEQETDKLNLVTRWVECEIPILAFGCTFDRSELGRWYKPGEEEERDAKVWAWMQKIGGPLPAMRASPVVAIWHPGCGILEKVDGWHRMRLAKRAGEEMAYCVVGIVE